MVGDFRRHGRILCAGRTRRAAGVSAFPSRAVGTSDGKTYGPEYRRHRQYLCFSPGRRCAGATREGPGNMLMDAWIWRQYAQPYDKDAAWAKEGQVILPLLQKMLRAIRTAASAPKVQDANISTWLVRASSYGTLAQTRAMYRPRWRSGGLHRPAGAAFNGGCRLMVCRRRKPESLVMADLAALLRPVSRFRPPIRRGCQRRYEALALHGFAANARLRPAGKLQRFRDGGCRSQCFEALFTRLTQ